MPKIATYKKWIKRACRFASDFQGRHTERHLDLCLYTILKQSQFTVKRQYPVRGGRVDYIVYDGGNRDVVELAVRTSKGLGAYNLERRKNEDELRKLMRIKNVARRILILADLRAEGLSDKQLERLEKNYHAYKPQGRGDGRHSVRIVYGHAAYASSVIWKPNNR